MKKEYLLLGFVIITAAVFRLYGLNWGLPFELHIDEKNVLAVTSMLADNISSNGSFNPHFSTYGALLFYLLLPFEILVSPQNLIFCSRLLAAFAGILTVVVTYQLGKSFKNYRVGLIAAMLSSISVILFRESHFYTAETPLLFFLMLALLAGYHILYTREKKYYLWFAIFMGLAASIKLIAVLLVLPLLTAHLGFRYGLTDRIKAMRHPSIWATLILAFTIYLALNPYCILDAATYWQKNNSADLLWNAMMIKGNVLPPWTVQFLDRTKGCYELYALYPWAMGPLLALAALFSLIGALNRSEGKYYYLLSWILPYLILTGSWQVKFIRYTIPVIPLLNILVADWLLGGRFLQSRIKTASVLLIVLSTYFYSASYLNVYRNEDSRLQAVRYLNQVATSKVVLSEVDEGFFLSELTDEGQQKFKVIKMDLLYQNLKSSQRKEVIDANLQKADYLALSSNNRLRFARLPKRFPVLARFYQVLFSEPQKLGFKKLTSFKHYPSFLGITVFDDQAELTFQLFDHPRITIFEKLKQ